MADDNIGLLMFRELMENHRNDYDGAVIKIEEWRGMINILEKFVEIAKKHPDGWQHVLKMMEEQFNAEEEEGE
ncbi:MAG: hypothetical protein O7E56_07565 [SAR324 cluster bacterium]|nr:hypothetical protein [SAR324 cluster bacterium]MCZ6628072.1 hypothetical protein [SAR324 cluster bacterium]MCZ6841354.1 hypothetical protein [SAR324 cluster bacterium]